MVARSAQCLRRLQRPVGESGWGRAPWREPLSDPRVVVRGRGECLILRRAKGFATGETHVVEKVVRILGVDDGDKQLPGMRAGDA
eukprot:11266894-Alexandrium_andersonii.AAC.1